MQYITRGFLLRFGFTISLGDCKPPSKEIHKEVEVYLEKAKTHDEEKDIMTCLNNAKTRVQK